MLVIVGGGFGSLEAAIQLRTLRPTCKVTVISPGPNLIYKPWLIHVPAGRRRLAELCIPLAPLAARYGFQLIEDRVDRVDLDAKQVLLAGGRAVDYSALLLAHGADADRGRIPGADEHALFPCHPEEAEKFVNAIQLRKPRSVCIAVGWDRRGPGLEFAGWLAARRRRLGLRDLNVEVVDGDGRLVEYYGAEAKAAIQEILAGRGATLSPEAGIDAVTESGAIVNGKSRDFELVAIVSPLRGVDVGLPPEMLDNFGFVRVGDTFETTRSGVFAFGDAAALPTLVATSRTMVSIRQRVGHLAHNLLARMDDQPLVPLQPSTGPHLAMLNIGGRALLLNENRVVGRGRLPLLRRWLYDQSYFRQRS